MNKVIPIVSFFICILLPLTNGTIFYFYNLYEAAIINGLIAGCFIGLFGHIWYMSKVAKTMEREYKDIQIKQIQAQDEMAVLWQKELDDMELKAEVIIDDNGNLNIKSDDSYIEEDKIREAYNKAMRKLSLRTLKKR